MSLISKDNLSLTLQSIKKLLSNKADKSEINELISKNTVQSDWNQNDEIQPDYIKNRPFYEYFLEEVVIVPEDVYDILSSRGQVFKGNFNMPIDGETYIVQFGDNIYEKKAEIGTFPPGYPARIGDLYDEFIIYLKPGEIWVETPSTGQKIIKIVNQNHRIKKIDEKYLPDLMSKNNPSGTGSFSLNRDPESEIGEYSFAEGYNAKASGKYSHAEGYYTTASGIGSHAEGYHATASGNYSHAEGNNTTASGNYSHAEGQSTKASRDKSHAEGSNTEASGYNSHAEGRETKASGENSHAEGQSTKASGYYSHAEGDSTEASGPKSHAEGYHTIASGENSHAEGYYTKASGEIQHVQGKQNIEDVDSIYAHIVGNGTSNTARSNAHTLDWSGNAWYSGDVYVSSTSGTNKDEGSKKLATEEYVNNAMAELEAKTDIAELEAKMDKTNPTGTGYFSLNKKAGSIIGDCAFAEGNNNVASGHASHAEGRDTTASGYISHAEGYYTTASGWYSHAEGCNTEVSGENSHAEGNNTIASGETQHVQGKFNLGDSQSIYAHIVGNGTHFHDRSNAHTLDWSGNAWYSGDVYVGSTSGSNKDEGSKKLATEEFVNNKVAKISNTDWNDLKNNLSQSIDNPWYYPIDAAKIEIYYQDSLFCTFVRTNVTSERGTSYWKYSGSCNNISIRNTLYGESFDFNNEKNQATVFFSDKFDRRYYDASGNGMMDVENNLIAKKNQSVTWLFGHLADMDENHVWNVINYSPITCNDCGKDNVALAMDMAHKYIAGLSNEPTSQNLKLTDTVTGIEYMITITNGKVTLTEVSE